jgi:Na+/melibiose symporter-like transporter
MFNAFFNSALPLYLGRYDIPYVLVGFLAQERSFVGAFLEPLVGAISDRTRTRFGRRRPFLLIGAPLAAIMLIILSQQPPMWWLVVILSLLPFFLAISNVPYRAMVADIALPAQRGRLGGTMSVLEMLGQVALLLLVARIWTTNENLVFVIIAAALVLGFGFTFLFSVREPMPLPQAGELQLAGPIQYLKRVLGFRQAAKYVACQFVFWLGVGGVTPFVTRYAVAELHIEESRAFLLLLLLVTFTAIFAIPAGYLGDKLGKKPILTTGLIIFATAILIGSQVTTLAGLAVVMIVVGIANAITTALGFAFLTELLPRQRMGELTGLSSMTWSFAQPLGSTCAGLLADQTGTLRSVFELAGALLLVSLLILLTVHPSPLPQEP